jgi:hypothetical protein
MADKQEAFNSTLTNAMPALPNDGTVTVGAVSPATLHAPV